MTLKTFAWFNKLSSLESLSLNSLLIGHLEPSVEVNSMVIEFPFTSH